MKTYDGMEVQVHSFLTSAALLPGIEPPLERMSDGPQSRSENCGEEKIPFSPPGGNLTPVT
jgi:hypothetical protein